jgi:drug/metabolite transporter (DMT)-like permease
MVRRVERTAAAESRDGARPTGLRIRPDRVATVAGLVTVGLWGSAFVGIRAVAVDLSPASIALGRLAIGSILLAPLVARMGWVALSRRDAALAIGMGVAWSAGYSIVLGAGERLVDVGTAAMLVGIGPILITVLAGLLLGEGWPARLLVGCAIAFGGTTVIGAASAGRPIGSGALAGVALCVLAALLYAIGVTLQKPILRAVPGVQVTWLACLIGAIACLPFAPTLAGEVTQARPETIAWLLYLGVFPTSIGFTTWAFALGRMTAGRAGTLSYLVSPTAILISWLLLGETPAGLAVVGGGLCVAGVVVARWGRPRLRARTAARSPSESSAT